MRQKIIAGLGVAIALGVALLWAAGKGWFGLHEGPGTPHPERRPGEVVTAVESQTRASAEDIGAHSDKQILFGDLHVHTTVSFDAFAISMPALDGEGSHPQSDACDYARFCSALDFWSINDHASGLTPRVWEETIDSIRQCNEIAGDPTNPDTVAFLGWEWTQVGTTPEDHFGHKNVVLAHTDDARIPTRPIGAGSTASATSNSVPPTLALGALALSEGGRTHDMARFFQERAAVPTCPDGVPSPDLLPDCRELAETPADLFRKLDEWGHDSIVIPHGTSWGMYGPTGTDWAKQLATRMHDPDRQTLLEIYSGHGNSEEYRDWRGIEEDPDGHVTCPAPRANYLPRCWRAGEIIEQRCLEDGTDPAECETRAADARDLAAQAGLQAHLTIPGYEPSEWLDAGQCRDCAQPAFNFRPGGSAQYIAALTNFDDPADTSAPRRFRFGFLASSDNHFARPGTGYKEVSRRGFTESTNRPPKSTLSAVMTPPKTERASKAVAFDRESSGLQAFQLFEMERQASFFLTGGLVATHANGRDRESIWEALQRRETYGTSGPRILLWFDLLNPPGSRGRSVPMGAEVEMGTAPIFQVRAAGSFAQKPGCPDYATGALSPEEVTRLCKGECYNPSDERRKITRIEVIRIRPQAQAGEPIAPLIEDPWRSFACDPDPAGCAATFTDPEYAVLERDTVYYARVIEDARPTINGGGFRCENDTDGNCTRITLCGTDDATDDCLSDSEPRAWSSPIYVDWPRQTGNEASANSGV